MNDLILGKEWVGPVHNLPERVFGVAPADRLTVVGALALHAVLRPDEAFLTEIREERNATFTYACANTEVRRRVAVLSRWGLMRGERVGVTGQNSADFVFAILAVLEAGGVAVLLSYQDPGHRLGARARFTQVRFLLYDSGVGFDAKSCSSAERICSFLEFGREALASDGADCNETFALPQPTDAALIFFTSGTTANPKAVVQSHFSVAQNAFAVAEHLAIGPGMKLLCVLPMYHVNGLELTVLSVMAAGAHTMIWPHFDAFRFWRVIEEHGIHLASLVPSLLRLLVDRPTLQLPSFARLPYVVSAASPLSTDLAARAWSRFRLRIVQGYGLSETTNFSCMMPLDLDDGEYKSWMLESGRTSVGPALAGQEVEIEGRGGISPPGVEGEVIIRGHCVMSGYLHNPSGTEEAFRGGWFHTGDLAYYLFDRAGRKYIHISGRIREIAKRSGAMVNLLEVDEVLASIPGVADVASTAFPNRWVDEEIAAVVVRQPGSALTHDDIIEHSRRALPFTNIPKAILFLDEVPRTPTGKVSRVEIAKQFSEFRDRLFVEQPPKRTQGETGWRKNDGTCGSDEPCP